MKKLFFIAGFIVCANIATALLPSQAESSVEQLVRIIMSNNTKHSSVYNLAKTRKPNDYQDVYNLATKHPELLKGIIHDGRTFAMLCVQRGYADLLEHLINKGCLVDLATPCNLYGPHEPQTTILHELLREVSTLRKFKDLYSEDYIARITGLTKLIINKYPYLLDIPVNRARTAGDVAIFLWGNLGDLIPRDQPQSVNDNSGFASYANTITATLESELLDACKACDLAIVQKLIKKPGVDVNKGDNNGDTPLIIASKKGHIEILELLLSLKKSDGSFAVNVNQSNMDGITPLIAACQKRDYHKVEKLLTVAGIDVNQADNNGEAPLLVACKNNSCNLSLNIIDLLLKSGAVNKANKKDETPLEITKDTSIYGYLELYLVGEVHASKWCSPLSAEHCHDVRERELKRACEAKEGIAFHE